MAEEMSPLLHYLKRANPEVDSTWSLTDGRSGAKPKGTGTSGPHDTYYLQDVLKWEGMEWKDLMPIFDDIFDLPVNNLPNFEDILMYPSHLNEVSDENSLETLLIRWNYPVVSSALSIAQDHAKFQDTIGASEHPHKISMARGGQAWIPKGKVSKDKPLTPDWAGIFLSCDEINQPDKSKKERHYLNVLPGDTKLSTKFKSEWGWDDQRFKDPVTQVFTYCRRASVPYGYIITQEELVILRLFHGDKEDPNILTEGTGIYEYVEYKSIPWENNMKHELTINLALWCLHMLAARRKPIGARKPLKSEYPTPDKTTMSRTTESESPNLGSSDGSLVRDTIEHSFGKRRRPQDASAAGSGGARENVKRKRTRR